MTRCFQLLALSIALTIASQLAWSDSARSRCGYSDSVGQEPAQWHPCVFSQWQGHITISASNTLAHDFITDGDSPGVFLDTDGKRVYRKSGLGERGQLFQLPQRFLFVLWDPAPSRLECDAAALSAPAGCGLGDGNVGFLLQATTGSSLNELTLTPIGLSIDNTAQVLELDGTAYLAELADLDANGWPEVYVYVSSAGSGSYGSLVAFAVNKGKSASPIYLPPMDQEPGASEGYQGHDEFRVVENRLVRRFPVYLVADTNAEPSGGMRQIQYRLEAGEAGWQLVADRMVEY
jgi:hypothetical protein